MKDQLIIERVKCKYCSIRELQYRRQTVRAYVVKTIASNRLLETENSKKNPGIKKVTEN